ncbi:hypothetical protein AMTR_s00058p00151070, partial [Amborella trichopoda]
MIVTQRRNQRRRHHPHPKIIGLLKKDSITHHQLISRPRFVGQTNGYLVRWPLVIQITIPLLSIPPHSLSSPVNVTLHMPPCPLTLVLGQLLARDSNHAEHLAPRESWSQVPLSNPSSISPQSSTLCLKLHPGSSLSPGRQSDLDDPAPDPHVWFSRSYPSNQPKESHPLALPP